MTLTKPPQNLREEIDKLLDTVSDEELASVHKVLLTLERDRLWKLIQEEAQRDADAGKYDNVPALIEEYRAKSRSR